jgi:glycosyltransferase involved in cell wall biosynthesis
MRVLHVIGGLAPRYGGTSATVLSLCEALARKQGVEVEVATTDADGPHGRLAEHTLPATSFPIRVFRRSFSERWKFSRGLLRWLWQSAGQYQLVHIHAVWSFATTAACWAARRHRVPYVILPQGMLAPYGWSRSYPVKRLYWNLLEKQNVARAARLVVTSQGEEEELASLGCSCRIEKIPLGLEREAWETPRRPDVLRKLCGGRSVGRPIVLFLSRLHPKKGLAEFLLPAFQSLSRDAFLAIAGGPDPHASGYADHVEREVKRLGLEDRVALFGPIEPADRWSLYDGADAFVLPSKNENFGLVVTEAMARGCPVIVSSEVHSSEHVAAAGAGDVVPLSVPEITGAIETMLADPIGREAMGRRGQEYARRHLSWEGIADSVVDMYGRCLAESRTTQDLCVHPSQV